MASSSSSIPIMASSSISGSNPPKYDVFLSFRGVDTRKNFTCHLNDALIRSGIVTFIDYREVEMGDEISSSLSNAIRSSSLSIIIFSQDYASSSWCLNELLEILECYETRGQIILPIFYHVSPSDIRKQNGTYGKAFAKHEERFKDTKDKVQKWRAALTQVASLSGSDLMLDDKQLETEFIEKIVKVVLAKLNRISSGDHLDPGLVGIRSRVERVESLLCLESTNICTIGIWGMGGIGKTTIAGAVYKRIANQFKAVCFLENVRDDPKIGPNHLQKKLLSGILGEGNHYMYDFTIRRLRSMKTLIVIDNVDDSIHLKDLVGDRSLFGPGSKIIVTSRDKQVLRNGVDEFKLYEVEGFNYVEALQLFSQNAFKQNHSPQDYMKLSSKIVHCAKGNPLALKVLGCSLFGKSLLQWESFLDKLKKCPNSKILKVLRISYDILDTQEKEIFLFIACFFKGENRDRVTTILNGCGFPTSIVISDLVDKCLLTITYNCLRMHDLIQEIGRDVVFHESVKEPSKRSRLCDPRDICDLFKNNTGTEAVESISLDLSRISELYISPDAFTRMRKLKLLKFYFIRPVYWLYSKRCKVGIRMKIKCEGLESLPDELRYLCWYGYPLKSLPLKFNPEHLVDLEMPGSKLQHLWKGTRFLRKLRRIDLRESRELTEVPDLSQAINLESMELGRCSSLTKFPKISFNATLTRLCLTETAIEEVPYSAMKSLSKIVKLDMRSNTRLRNLPSLRDLTSLKKLNLKGCSNITEFPEISGEIHSLELCETGIEEVPSSVGRLTNLGVLTLKDCKRLKKVSSSIFQLKKLRGSVINLSGCSKLENFPEVLENEGMPPNSLRNLTNLSGYDPNVIRLVYMSGCKNLKSLPNSLCNQTSLTSLDLSGCPGVEKVLENVLLSSPSGLCSLKSLVLSGCNMEVLPTALSRLSYLDRLNLRGNEFESLSLKLFTSLRRLDISNCKRLRYLQDFPLPSRLVVFVASNCTSLETLPDTNGIPADYNCFYYYHNCFKLDERARINIQTDAQLRTQLMDSSFKRSIFINYPIINNTRSLSDAYFREDGRESFCFPGSEIPEWFIYQNQGSSIKIDLPPHWYSNKFVGFVVCIVASCESSNHIGRSYVKCECKIKDPDCDGQDITFNFPDTVIEHPMSSDHVFIKSIMPNTVRVVRKSDGKHFKMTDGRFNTENSFCWQKAPFRFSTSNARCKVKKCGIKLLHSE